MTMYLPFINSQIKVLIHKMPINSHIKFCVCFWVNHAKRYERADLKHTYYFTQPHAKNDPCMFGLRDNVQSSMSEIKGNR